MREGIHERIQAEIYHEDRERAFQAEESLGAPLEWNKVEDLIMDDGEILAKIMKPKKRRRDEAVGIKCLIFKTEKYILSSPEVVSFMKKII